MPTAFAYVRCSHLDSAESGLGLAAQEATVRAYYDFLRLRDPNLRELRFHPDVCRDLAISAYKKSSASFDKRPGARKLLGMVKPGDHILFARLDRAFRNALEARLWINHWKESGVRVHFVDLQIDIGTATGMMIFGFMSYVAEWYSASISERTKEGLRQKLLRDGDVNGRSVGKKRVPTDDGEYRMEEDRARLVRMRWVRWVYGHINARRRQAGLEPYSSTELAVLYDRCIAKREGREPYKAVSRMPLQPKAARRDFHRAAILWPDRYSTNQG